MEVSEVAKLIGNYGLAGLVAMLMWRGLPELVKVLREIKDEFITALREHSEKDMSRHEETREAITNVKERIIAIETTLHERADPTPVRTAKLRAGTYPRIRRDDDER